MKTEQSRRTRYPVLLCAGIVMVSLLLPVLVFSLWDRALLNGPHSQSAAQAGALSAEGRASETACLLYDCAHMLNVQYGSAANTGWSEAPNGKDGKALMQDALLRLEEACLLSASGAQAAREACESDAAEWQALTADGGLTMVQCSGTDQSLSLVVTRKGLPVYFSFQAGQKAEPTADNALENYIVLLGLDTFDDWQSVETSGTADKAVYSAQAQLYLTANGRNGETLAAVSITPEDLARLTAA